MGVPTAINYWCDADLARLSRPAARRGRYLRRAGFVSEALKAGNGSTEPYLSVAQDYLH